MFGSETWSLSKSATDSLDRFERKLLRKVVDPILENGISNCRKNRELHEVYKEYNITSLITIQELR